MSKINFNLFGSQIDFVRDLDTKYTAFVGGFRSGKTYALMAKSVVLAANNPHSTGAICLPTHGMATRGFKPEWEDFLFGHNIKYERLSSVNGYNLWFNGLWSRVLLMSSENYNRARNLTAAWFALDETDAMVKNRAWDAWNLFISRLSGGRIRRGFCVSTPEGYNFMYSTFQEQLEDKPELKQYYKLYRGATADNPTLPDDYIPALEAKYPKQLVRAYLNGEFVNLASGNVYYQFDRYRNHTDKTIADYPRNILHIGQDFNIGECASTVSVVDKGKVYTIDEITKQYDTKAVIEEINSRYPDRVIYMYPDPAGTAGKTSSSKSDIQQLRDAGFEIYHHKAHPQIRDRVNAVNALFGTSSGEIRSYINTNICKQLTKSLEHQGYDEQKKPDKSKGLDHLVDAHGYFIEYRYPITRGGTIHTF